MKNKQHKNLSAQDHSADTTFFKDIRELILSARKAVVRNIDTIQVITNFEIGRRIVEREQQGERRAGYGDKILKHLSQRLTKEFGKGFSLTNLKLIRQFYMVYAGRIGQTVSDQLQKVPMSFVQCEKSLQLRKMRTVSGEFKNPP